MKWEYTVLANDAELNQLGQEGWELVGVQGHKLYLKRQYKAQLLKSDKPWNGPVRLTPEEKAKASV